MEKKFKTVAQLRKWLEGKRGPIEIWGSINEDGEGWINTENDEFHNI